MLKVNLTFYKKYDIILKKDFFKTAIKFATIFLVFYLLPSTYSFLAYFNHRALL